MKEESDKAHAEAMKFAMADDMKSALPLFIQSCGTDPKNANKLSDLGVTQMRMNMLDEAKETFDLALELVGHTNDQNLMSNIDALQSRIDFANGINREPASGGAHVTAGEYEDEEEDDEDEDKAESGD